MTNLIAPIITKVTFRKGEAQRRTATIQLASKTIAVVFHLPSCCPSDGWKKGKLPPALKDLLETRAVKKVGLNIRGDSQKLQRDFGIRLGGTVELLDLAKAAYPNDDHGSWTLQRLTYWVLRKVLSKDARVRFCDWEKKLSEEQKEYAARDAAAGLQIYHVLSALGPDDRPPQPPPPGWEANLAPAGQVDAQVKTFLAAWSESPEKGAQALADFPDHFTALVKLDPFHLLQRYGRSLSSKSDPLFAVFMSMMRDALFETNKEDEELLKAYLRHSRGATQDQVNKMPRSYFVKNCRRQIPPPPILAARLHNVYDLFKNAAMANGKPLYRQKSRRGTMCQCILARTHNENNPCHVLICVSEYFCHRYCREKHGGDAQKYLGACIARMCE